MDLEVDQSGRIEESGPTAIAVSNGKHRTTLLSARVKREVFGRLRRMGNSSKRACVRTFAAGVFLTILPVCDSNTRIAIDLEYPGYEATIKSMLLRWGQKAGVSVPPESISFRQIGRSSPAHHRAYHVFRKTQEPDRVLSVADLMDLLGEKK